jgi:hypothetical protein
MRWLIRALIFHHGRCEVSFQADAYQEARGGYSQMLRVSCSKCGQSVGEYQKDGPGPLKRMYVDRLSLVSGDTEFSVGKFLNCSRCHGPLALGYIYPKEQRPAWLRFAHATRLRPANYLDALLCWARGIFS